MFDRFLRSRRLRRAFAAKPYVARTWKGLLLRNIHVGRAARIRP